MRDKRTLLVRRGFCILVGAWFMVSAAGATAADPTPSDAGKASERFVRLSRGPDKKPISLETPIVRLKPVEGDRDLTVDLVAAVHIGEKDYYQQLNREFEGYDAVLYELVTPENARAPRPNDPTGNHPVTLLQNFMKDVLKLEFQLKGIDYTRANMVHADMSPDQFAKSMEARGESVMTMMARMFGYALAQQAESGSGGSNTDLLLALFDKNRAVALKRVFAEQFENSEGSMIALDGPNGSTLISGRNQVALDVLKKEIAAGKRKIAIFYGAAHMPDFQKRLRNDFGLAPVDTRWLVAWNLKP